MANEYNIKNGLKVEGDIYDQNGKVQANVIETVKVNNVALTPDGSKAVNIDLTGKSDKSTTTIIHEVGTGISIDFSYIEPQVIFDSGYTNAIALDTFTNMPTEQCERCINFLNNRTTSVVMTPRTTSLISNGITYAFYNLDATTKTLARSLRCEISYKFLKQDATNYVVVLSAK